MDEVSFHLYQCLESLQIIVNNLIHNGKIVIQNVQDNAQSLLVQLRGPYLSSLQAWWQAVFQQLRQNIQYIYSYKGPYVFADAFNKTNAFSATLGLLCGTGIGLIIGCCLQYPLYPVSSMKAIGCLNFSGIEDISMDDTCLPSILSSDEVLVKVVAASLDPVDIKIASGHARTLRQLLTRQNQNRRTHVPVILGRDCAGVVMKVGSAVTKFEIGDEVWAAVPSYAQGLLCEYTVLRQDCLAKKPRMLSFPEATSLAYSGSEAWHALFNIARLNTENAKNKKILIHCASTGVGCVLTQLCHLLQSHVTVTCLSRAVQVMLGFGASYCIPLETPDLGEELVKQRARYDVVFNCGGDAEAKVLCSQLCNKQGMVVSVIATPLSSDSLGLFLGIVYSLYVYVFHLLGRRSWVGPVLSSSTLESLGSLVDSGHLQPVVGSLVPARNHQKALHLVDSAQVIGKTVLQFVR